MTTLIERLNEDGAALALEAASEFARLQASVATRDTQIASLREALKPFIQIGWMTHDTEHTARTIVAHMHPESRHEIILSSEDFRRAKTAYEQRVEK